MAAIHSLGLHEPSALSYLVSEGLLPSNPLASAYRWDYQQTLQDAGYVTDEILQTDLTVVWSRNGMIQRVFNLDIEGESITHAFTTSFDIDHGRENSQLGRSYQPKHPIERALVVILRTQAHIFLLSGDTHVVPLSFEVQTAFPTARGFFLQRRISQQPRLQDTISPQVASLNLEVPVYSTSHDANLTTATRTTARAFSAGLPRTFAFPELLSEPSLIVYSSSRKHEYLEGSPVLPSDEDIRYVSASDELHENHASKNESVFVAVTTNVKLQTITLWQVVFKTGDPEDPLRRRANEKPGRTSRRKSSNVYGRQTGAATPIVRGTGGLRESTGPVTQTVPGSGMFHLGRDASVAQTGDLAAHLGHEFDQIGVQTRSARRVSSMLARTDLGGANDRTAFNDMALGSLGRKSFGRSIKRGESLGGFSDRQSFGVRRRSSFQAASSIYSEGTSFLDIPASHLLDDVHLQTGVDPTDELKSSGTTSKLSRNVAFLKLKSLSYELPSLDGEVDQVLKVMTMLAPDRSTADDRRSRIVSVCIMDNHKQQMTIVNVAAKVALSTSKHKADGVAYDLKAVEVQRGQSIVDACYLAEESVKRLVILTQTREGRSVLHLEAPWSVSYRLTLPTQFKIFDASGTTRSNSPVSRRETGIHRIIPDSEIKVRRLGNCESMDQILAQDVELRYHRLRFQLMPNSSLIRRVLELCNFILAPEFYDSILVAWWEVKRWIEIQDTETNLEWTAMVVTMFVLAVPFIGNLQNRPAQGQRRKKAGPLRSSSGITVDMSHWDLMQEIESSDPSGLCTDSPSWSWIEPETKPKVEPKSPSKHARGVSISTTDETQPDTFLIRCTNMARDFLQSPAGENATGPEGYLPIAINKDRTFRRTALAVILVGLHLLREELKLHEITLNTPGESLEHLALVIMQLGSWLKWKSWTAKAGQYYYTEIRDPDRWMMEPSMIDNLDVPAQPFEPPSIFQHIEDCIVASNIKPFRSLLDLVSQSKPITHSHPLWKSAARITPRLFVLTAFLSHIGQKTKPRSIVKHMLSCGIDSQTLDTIPIGIAAVCFQAIVSIKGQPFTNWSTEAKALLGRANPNSIDHNAGGRPNPSHISHVHDAIRDYRAISNGAIDAENVSRWDAFSEIDRQAVTRLIFHEDRRFQEASKLVNQTRPPTVECTPEPGWSEADLLEAQKELAVHVTRRTLSVAAGRAMMHFNARRPLLTERVPIPAFSLQCVMKVRGNSDNNQPMTLSADKALFTEDKVCWAFFHNGASAGLMISRDTKWIDTSWILYNKPPELTNRHAGFLLALGLNGHLKFLAKWVAFKYLTPKHTMTSVGLLLGLAASYLGTMDTLIARLLSIHVTRLLPDGAAELNLSPLTQTTGIIGVGLLYCNSQHRRMSEIMLTEIENSDSESRSGDEPILRDEGYRLAAGFSLGLINLGQGTKLHSLHDMAVIERLLTIAIGTKNVNLVHVLDRATAGAVIAVTFIFMKTNDEDIARKIDIPDTMHQFDYVRPDIFLLRTMARHLIMWDSITPTQNFIRQSLPVAFRQRADLSTTKKLSTDDMPFFNIVAGVCFAVALRYAGSQRSDARDLLIFYLDQFIRITKLPALNYDAKVTLNGVRNCLDVLALSCATVMAGSGDIAVMRRLRALHGRTDKETPFGSHLAAHMALGVLFLSGGTATFCTSNLAVAALVISLYPLFPVDVLDNKCHLQALRHLWVLAVENRCLVARDHDSQQVISDLHVDVQLVNGTVEKLKIPGLLPEFDKIRKVSFEHENYWPVEIDLEAPSKTGYATGAHRTSAELHRTLRDYIKSRGTGVQILLQRRAAYEKPNTSIFMAELQALDEARCVPSTDSNARVNEKWRQTTGSSTSADKSQSKDPFDWVFELDAFKHLDYAERALLLGDTEITNDSDRGILKQTPVDAMLDLESVCFSSGFHDEDEDGHQEQKKKLGSSTMNKDQLWQLRLLFDWTDKWDAEEEEADDTEESGYTRQKASMRWMKREVIDELRSRIWKLAGGNTE